MIAAEHLNSQAQRVHILNYKWWHDAEGNRINREPGQLLALVNTELSEAVEGFRRDCNDDHLLYRKMAEVELADALIRILDYAGGFSIEIGEGSVAGTCDRWEDDATSVLEMMKVVGKIHDARAHGASGMEALWIRHLINSIHAFSYERGFDLWGAYEEKLAYNQKREDHTHEARARAGGKAW